MLVLVGWVAVLVAGIAVAVSGGGYDPHEQDCSPRANANNAPKGSTEAGCHTFKLNVEDESGKRYAEAGVDQLPNGYPSTPGLFGVGYPQSPNFPHSGCLAVDTDGTGGGAAAPHRRNASGCGTSTKGLGLALLFDTENPSRNRLTQNVGAPDFAALLPSIMGGMAPYLGADDNLDAGEHDGVAGVGPKGRPDGSAGSANGPSDGGAVTAHVTPKAATATPTLSNPVPVAGATEGFCADGYCQDVTTRRHAVYHGSGRGDRSVANYQGKRWDPYNCSSGDLKSEGPGCRGGRGQPQTLDGWRGAEKKRVYADPGVQVYEDPDAQASPLDPTYEAGVTPQPALYPIPAAYAGSCGAVVGGGPVARAPSGTPSTNSAGQVVASTGC
jgi:hypothetical protein